MARFLSSIFLLSSLFTNILVSADTISCSDSSHCPQDTPCCSQYGVCGIGSYCLGGCDPRYSYSIDSCMPAPICKSQTYTFENISKSMTDYSTYLGDSSTAAWTYSGYPLQYGENVLLTMPANSAGTVLMSTDYVWYGEVSCTMKTSESQGVVTAFIFMSDVKDEIDYEFVGKDLETAQTNLYWQALPYYGNSANITNITDTFTDWHTYTVDWQSDQIIWSVDGVTHRTKTRASTWNDTSQLYNYPQTPSRIQISVWPGGAASQAEGTIEWAGGAINWSGPDIQQYGYYFMQVANCTVKCYDPPAGTPTDGSGNVSYIFNTNQNQFLNNSVIRISLMYETNEVSDKGTSLKSQLGSGTNTTAAPANGASVTAQADPNAGNFGGGSADGSRGSSSSSPSSNNGTSFVQGNGSTSGVARLVATWSGVAAMVIAGVFALL